MKIVIAGAGDVGFHLAKLLTKESQDITLIDYNTDVLEFAAGHLDAKTLKGDSSSIELLQEADVKDCDILLAVTTSEKNNILTAILAKSLGAKKTIARVRNPEYLTEIQKNNFAKLGVDHLISPRELAALEIERLIKRAGFTDLFEFHEGKLSLIGFTLYDDSPLINKQIRDITYPPFDNFISTIAILRGSETIIPRGETILKANDHLYLATKNEKIDELTNFIGKDLIKIKKVLIIGGTPLSFRTAQMLEEKYELTIIEKDKEICKELVERLHKTLIINADPGNLEVLQEEGLANMDAVIALTKNSETNILSCALAEQLGKVKTIAWVDNTDYIHISQSIGIDTIINTKLIAANNIFRFVRDGNVEAIAGLHGVNAEIIEYVIDKDNNLTNKTIKDLTFPTNAIIIAVIRDGGCIIPKGHDQLKLKDKVIVFSMPEAISKVEKLFV